MGTLRAKMTINTYSFGNSVHVHKVDWAAGGTSVYTAVYQYTTSTTMILPVLLTHDRALPSIRRWFIRPTAHTSHSFVFCDGCTCVPKGFKHFHRSSGLKGLVHLPVESRAVRTQPLQSTGKITVLYDLWCTRIINSINISVPDRLDDGIIASAFH